MAATNTAQVAASLYGRQVALHLVHGDADTVVPIALAECAFNISEHADGECRGPVPIQTSLKACLVEALSDATLRDPS